jgi:hypothetical protein
MKSRVVTMGMHQIGRVVGVSVNGRHDSAKALITAERDGYE